MIPKAHIEYSYLSRIGVVPNKHDIKTQRISQSVPNAMFQNESVLQVVDPFEGGHFQVDTMGEPLTIHCSCS